MIEIKGVIKNYEWGGHHYISMMTDSDLSDMPMAELWLGDHKSGSSMLVDGSSLSKWIEASPEYRLGKKLVQRFGTQLPYLFKILDVKEPLSIQVHPTLEQAKQGFLREHSLGIPVQLRSYMDENHKPELMLALSDFYLLHGFRNVTEVLDELGLFKSFDPLVRLYSDLGIQGFVSSIFALPADRIRSLLLPVIEQYRNAYHQNEISKSEPLFWFMRSVEIIQKKARPLDPGLIMIFIMNLMYVPKGGVVFQDAGVPHAYLEGQNLELMANSDNVVRCGLTPKHIDIQELLAITKFSPIVPKTLAGKPSLDGGLDYIVESDDFQLREYRLDKGQSLTTPDELGACIWFVLSGEIRLGNHHHYSRSGSAFYQRPEEVNVIHATSDALIYRASVSARVFT